jgi:PAS domain S-box-containing protein
MTDAPVPRATEHGEVKRAELLLELYVKAPALTDRELYDYVLDKAVELTGSTIGFFHQVAEDQDTVILTTWNAAALENCDAAYDAHYPLAEAGNWLDCVRQGRPVLYNDFPNSPNQKGLPEGHTPLKRFMSVPVMEGDKVRYVFGVGNKQEDYGEHDVVQTQLIANELTKIMMQRRAEFALKESEERFSLATRSAGIGVWDWDVKRNVLLWDDKVYELYGVRREDFSGAYEAWASTVHPDDLAKADAEVQLALKGERDFVSEFRVIWPDGSIRHIEALADVYRNENGEPVRMIGVNWDITERRQAEDELRRHREDLEELVAERTAALEERQRRIRTLVENAPGVTYRCLLDSDWTMLFISDAITELVGYPPSDFIGNAARTFASVIDAEDRDRVEREVTEAVRNSEPYVLEYRVRHADGGTRWVLERGRQERGETNEGVLDGFIFDITDRKRMEQELFEAKEQAEQANRAKSTFLANMSHEIRTPMNAILGFSQLMERDRSLQTGHRENVHAIMRSGEHLLALINDTLDMSKIEAGRMMNRPTDIDLHGLLGDLETTFRVRTDAEGLSLVLDIGVEVPRYVRCDEGKLRQILINLLGNAVKFTDEGGISVRASRLRTDGKTRVVIDVADTGPGVDPEDVERIFEPFEQTGTTLRAGTGLGLPISRQFARLMGGDLTIRSQAGQGSVFRLDLPCVPVGSPDRGMRGAGEANAYQACGRPRGRTAALSDSGCRRQGGESHAVAPVAVNAGIRDQ